MAFLSDLKNVFTGDDTAADAVLNGKPGAAPTARHSAGQPANITIGGAGSWETARNVVAEAFQLKLKRAYENRHFLACGTTGSGKSTLFYQMFDQIRARGDKAIIVDNGGESLMRYWRPGDIVLNPFDKRCPGWRPGNEIREETDYSNMSRFVVPDAAGSQAEWNRYGQKVYASVSRGAEIEGRTSAKEIANLIAEAESENLKKMTSGLPGAGMFNKGSEKMCANARTIVDTYLEAWNHMPDGDFSIRDWVEDDDDRRWIFLSYKESNFEALAGFISMAISIAITYCLDLPAQPDRRIWFSIDELGSLPKMKSLVDAMTKIRKKGGCVVAGMQTFSQLQETYGREGATTLISNFNSWICMRPGDAETAELFSKHFGEEDTLKTSYTKNEGHGGGGHNQGESEANQWHVERIQTYTELMRLDDLCAVVKLPGNLPVGFTRIPYIDRPKLTEAYIPRIPIKARIQEGTPA